MLASTAAASPARSAHQQQGRRRQPFPEEEPGEENGEDRIGIADQ
jgi:hypothetical protein